MAVDNPLYHDIILEHYEYPRNKGEIERPDAMSRGANAMCGDDLMVALRLGEAGQEVEEIGWTGHACAIGEASASMMTEVVKGGMSDDARRWVKTVRGLVTNKPDEIDPDLELGDVESLEGIKNYPVRVKCALLAWEALDEALTIAERKRGEKRV
jgi:nitrogen fixation NifU-like protein